MRGAQYPFVFQRRKIKPQKLFEMTKEIRKIEVVPYDSDWPKQFEAEAELIRNALGDECIAIHHVGSTSVPGLAAKPKIDMIAAVKNPEGVIQKLESIGFKYRGEYNIPMHYGFSKRGEKEVNLHVYEEGNPEIELNLTFRDYLRSHPEVRDEYGALKLDLLKKKTSFEKNDSMFTGYNLGKNAFITSVLKRGGFNRLRFVICTHFDEWEVAKALRKGYFFGAGEDPYTWTFNHPEHLHLILYKGVEIVGYAHLQRLPKEKVALRIFVIEKRERKRGYGRQFLHWIEVYLSSKGYKSIHVQAHPDSVGFYKEGGYAPMPFGEKGDPRDTPMGKVLNSVEKLPSDALLSCSAKAWNLKDFQFVRKMENIVFSCTSERGQAYLRLTTPLRRKREEIKEEIEWIEFLAQSGINVPQILLTHQGDKMVSLKEGTQEYEGVVFLEMKGKHPSIAEAKEPQFLRALGAVIAKMHQASTLYEKQHQKACREEWFAERGLRHALEAARHSETRTLRSQLEEMVLWMKQLPRTKETYGLIHADLGAPNLFIRDDQSIGVIDFDDCCHHWFVFDLAIVIYSMASRLGHETPSPKEEMWLEELLQGYHAVRDLTDEEIAWIPKFIHFACLRLYFWIESHEALQTFHKDAIPLVKKLKMWAKKRGDHFGHEIS